MNNLVTEKQLERYNYNISVNLLAQQFDLNF